MTSSSPVNLPVIDFLCQLRAVKPEENFIVVSDGSNNSAKFKELIVRDERQTIIVNQVAYSPKFILEDMNQFTNSFTWVYLQFNMKTVLDNALLLALLTLQLKQKVIKE